MFKMNQPEQKKLENDFTKKQKTMKNLFLILISLSVFAACSSDETAKDQSSGANEQTDAALETVTKVVNVNVENLKFEPFTSYIRLVGEVKSIDDIRYSAEVNGKLLYYKVEEGGLVKAGQVFAKIDDEMLKKDVERMEANVAASRENFERLETIWKKDSIGTEIGYLNAKYAYVQARATLDQLKIQLRKTNVTSPINGILETQFVKAGEMVGAGTPIVRIIGNDKVKIEVGVPANYAGSIVKGDGAIIEFDAFPGKKYESTVSYVASSILTQSRTFKIEMQMPNTDNALKIDMTANVTLETNRLESAIVVAQEYVFRTEKGYEVFIVGKDSQGDLVAKSVMVKLGPSFNNKVVVAEGLNVGDKLITRGSGNIENLSRLTIVEKTSTVASAIN